MSPQTMRWERYENASRNTKNTARFLLGDKVVFSGYAPDDELNDTLCRLFNEARKIGSLVDD